MNNIDKEKLLAEITRGVMIELKNHGLIDPTQKERTIPVGISARHIHLQQDHLELLFGKGFELTKFKDISQPNQFACNEKVSIKGPRGKIDHVRILGPLRPRTQVEISRTDARTLGVNPPVRSSGDIKDSAPIEVIGPKGSIAIHEGCIVADRHIHMTPKDAQNFGVQDKQKVSVIVEGAKGGVMGQVTIRVKDTYALDMHIDTDDGNAFGLTGNEFVKILS